MTICIAEGKTKRIFVVPEDSKLVVVESKNDITAGDGKKHDVIEGKAQLATMTACNVFRLLSQCPDIPLAFIKQLDDVRFLAKACTMLLYEVVVRREAHGSYVKRNAHVEKGYVAKKLIVEFFLKTTGKDWEGIPLPVDDPLIVFSVGFGKGAMRLYHPEKPATDGPPIAMLNDYPCHGKPEIFESMRDIAIRTFLVLEKAWQIQGRRLVDFKCEFGVDKDGKLCLADVIDNDSWRLLEGTKHLDKQAYRDGASLESVTEKYKKVTALTAQFCLPRQGLIFWRGSDKDDLTSLTAAFGVYNGEHTDDLEVSVHTCSMHKKPEHALEELKNAVQRMPNSVIVAYVGMSNGAGPTLAAATHVPVITVPAGVKDFSPDVWSSLRAPSDVPVMTVLDPANAVLAALQILAVNNPRLYAKLRERQEKRFTNYMQL